MKTPTTPFTVLMLALTLAGSATQARAEAPVDLGDTMRTSDGKVIVPDDFIGLLAPNQMYKKDAATAELGSFATTTNVLKGIGDLQRSESGVVTADPEIVAAEDQMKADGTLKDVIRQGKGAILVLPDGKISWSDYEKHFNSMPIDPATCATAACPPEIKAYVEKQEKAAEEKAANEKGFSGEKTMFGANKNTPSSDPQDQSQDTDKIALETGAGIGGLLRDSWNQSPDSGAGGIGGDVGAGGLGAGEVGKIEAKTLSMSKLPLSYKHNIEFESKIPERIEGLRKTLDQGSSGKGDLAPNTAPSRGVVATHQ